MLLNNFDKTVPFRMSPAQLESLRLLRKRMNSPSAIQDDEEEKLVEDTNIWNADLKTVNQIQMTISDVNNVCLIKQDQP